MIYLYYSDSKEKDLVEGWANYGTKMGFTTYASSVTGYETVSTDCSMLQYYASVDTWPKNVSYDCDTTCTTSNVGKLSVDYNNTTISQGTSSSLYPWNYIKSNHPWKSNYIIDPLQLETEHKMFNWFKI